ncbi:MAG: AAA family ATPase [Candidatus Nomurabacteria bacterium]|jgi:DNA polymerase III delta prime subunit|nr:AAA family ATPase [Candidatus Nomurabacteria bacterium]
MPEPILNPKSRLMLESYLRVPSHALLLTGKVGVGLGTTAKYLARIIAGADVVTVTPQIHKNQTTRNINVDDIKLIASLTRTKRAENLAVIIDECERMVAMAPEAFLKQLEEPNSNIHYILTSHNSHNLPATILSRVQQIEILPVKKADCQSLLSPVDDSAKRAQIEFIAEGLPAETVRLSTDDDYFQTMSNMFELAKKIMAASVYERLKIISGVKDRDSAIKLVETIGRLNTLLSGKQPNFINNLQTISDVAENLAANGNIKAQLTFLVTNMI